MGNASGWAVPLDGQRRMFSVYGVVCRWIDGVEVSWCVGLSDLTSLYVVIDVSWSLGVPMVLGSNKSHMSIFFTQYKVQFQSRMSLGVSGPQSPCCVFSSRGLSSVVCSNTVRLNQLFLIDLASVIGACSPGLLLVCPLFWTQIYGPSYVLS